MNGNPEDLTKNGTAFAVIINSDCTDGRGHPVITHLCEIEATAARLAKGVDVQGSNGMVSEVPIFKMRGWNYGPINRLVPPKDWDQYQQKLITENRERAEKGRIAIAAAKASGLSDEHLKALIDALRP